MSKLRIWWIPQVPMQPFYANVETVKEGVLIINTLAQYDKFEFDNNVKPDYSNAGGLQIFENNEWCDWYDEETGEDDPLKHVNNINQQEE